MKILSVILIVLCCIEVHSQNVRNACLKTAFASITKALGKQNHEVAIIADEYSSNLIESVASAVIAEVPHNVARFKNSE